MHVLLCLYAVNQNSLGVVKCVIFVKMALSFTLKNGIVQPLFEHLMFCLLYRAAVVGSVGACRFLEGILTVILLYSMVAN